jgi:hypothetical protein
MLLLKVTPQNVGILVDNVIGDNLVGGEYNVIFMPGDI